LVNETLKAYYEHILGELHRVKGDEYEALCPFHSDHSPSFKVNLGKEDGIWNCPPCGGGDSVIGFTAAYFDVPYAVAKAVYEDYCTSGTNKVLFMDTLPNQVRDRHSEFMYSETPQMKNAREAVRKRGISESVMQEYQLGWTSKGGFPRLIIPVHNYRGDVVNCRLYCLPEYRKGVKAKVINLPLKNDEDEDSKIGISRFFPYKNLMNNNPIFLFEGEPDCLVGLSWDLNALTSTGGAKNWPTALDIFTKGFPLPAPINYPMLFKGRDVYVVYDTDKTGTEAAKMIIERHLLPIGAKVKNVKLTFEDATHNDFTDWKSEGRTKEELMKLIEDTPYYVPKADGDVLDADKAPVVTSLYHAAHDSNMMNIPLKMDVHVIGKRSATSNVYQEYRVYCTSSGGKKCNNCKLTYCEGGEMLYKQPISRQLIDLAESSDDAIKSKLTKKHDLGCSEWNLELVQMYKVDYITMKPVVTEYGVTNVTDDHAHQITQSGYFIYSSSSEAILPNNPYEVEGYCVHHPANQETTFILTKATLKEKSAQLFKMTPEIKEQLMKFRPKPGQSVKEKFQEIHDDFCKAKIVNPGTYKVGFGMDIIFHSPLDFEFNNDRSITRKWCEGMIVGDPRTGKSSVAKGLMEHYRAGTFIDCEHISIAGLVGGVQPYNNGRVWQLSWGIIPQNDMGLCVLDEITGASTTVYGEMSSLRSEGVARITKIQGGTTYARTRLIWMGNCRTETLMAKNRRGIDAVWEIMGKAEDIARFDFVITISEEEVHKIDLDYQQAPDVYDSDSCQRLVQWAWSRNSKHIVFNTEMVIYVRERAKTIAEKYESSVIPLCNKMDFEIKLARMTAAVACRMYSTDEAGENVIIQREHVDFVVGCLNEWYDDESFQYGFRSKRKQVEAKRITSNLEATNKLLRKYPQFAQLLSGQQEFTKQLLVDIMDGDQGAATTCIAEFFRLNMIKVRGNVYRAQPEMLRLVADYELWREQQDNEAKEKQQERENYLKNLEKKPKI
jgi:hypothetical protein